MRTVTAVFSVPDAVADEMLNHNQPLYERRKQLMDAIARGDVDLVACLAFEPQRVEATA